PNHSLWGAPVLFVKKEDHDGHLRLVLELLKKERLFAKFSKCEFWLQEVHFLGHVVDSNGIHVHPSKIKVAKNWKALKTPSEIRSFLELDGYYRRFITLKDNMCNTPILSLPDRAEDFVVYCDASNQGRLAEGITVGSDLVGTGRSDGDGRSCCDDGKALEVGV
nr:putative reverse transcriptase domain-containing protein [Tanacetum cinerariifolium]